MGKKCRFPNGFGSVYKLSGNRRRPYAIAITIGIDKNGKQLKKIIGYSKDREEGIMLLSEYHKNPYDLDLKNLTFEEVWGYVLKDLDKLVFNGKMSQSNVDCLMSAYKVHCKPLYKEKLMELKRKKMQFIIDNSGLKRTGKGHIKTVCCKIFQYAIDELDLPLDKNPAEKLEAGDRNESENGIPFTDDEIKILWDNSSNDIIKINLINCYSGMRPNEIFNIDLTNIHLDNNYMVGGSKTEAGKNRIIPIHPRIKPFIEYFVSIGLDYPFRNVIDNFNYGKYSRQFQKLMNKLNMEHTPYDARHTFITKMKKAGSNEYLLKRIVGHSIQDLTERVYTHRDIEELIEEVRRIK